MIKFVHEPIFRPPQETESIQLHATQGCTYNRCKFCYVFKNSTYQIAPMRQIKQGLLGQAYEKPADSPVYLSGGNAFSLSFDRLRDIALCIKEHVPGCPRISMYARMEDIDRKTDEELRELQSLGINHLYPGTESGSIDALRIMDKGITPEQSLVQLLRLEKAGIAYTASYILGLAGRGMSSDSATKTADFFNHLHPVRIATTGLTVFPGAPLKEMVESGQFVEADEREKIQELLLFLRKLTVETVLDCRHYLNMVNFVVSLPLEQSAIINDIEQFLSEITDEQIVESYRRSSFKFI